MGKEAPKLAGTLRFLLDTGDLELELCFCFFEFIGIVLTYNIISVSDVQHSDLTFTTLYKMSITVSLVIISPYKVIAVLLTVFLMLYIISQ